jgi:hypothetical protein
MSVQTNLIYELAPIDLIAPQTNGSIITGGYIHVGFTVGKFWLIVKINQANAATVTITPLQATSLSGTGSKVLGNTGLTVQPGCQIWLNDNTAISGGSDAFVAQTAALNYTTDALLQTKIVAFEIVLAEHLDIPNGFNHFGVQIGASNGANIVTATAHLYQSFRGANQFTTYQ